MVKKELMIQALKKSMGVVSSACEEVDITRKTHYNWLKDDPDYKERVEDVSEYVIDFAESALYKNIKKGDNTAIIFYLKTKAKSRGYIERSEQVVEHKGEGLKIIINERKEAKK